MAAFHAGQDLLAWIVMELAERGVGLTRQIDSDVVQRLYTIGILNND